MRRLWNRHLVLAQLRSFAARILMVVATLAVVSPAGHALNDVARSKVRIAYTEFPPAEYRNEQGEPAGFFVDLTRKVVREAGYEPEFIYLPVSRVYLYLKSGAVDLFPGLSGVPLLKYEVLESWVNVYPTRLNAWHLEDVEPLTHFGQLEGKTVIVIGGYTYGGLLTWLENSDDIRLTEAPNSRAALEMLKLKRGDYVLDYRETVEPMLTLPSDSKILGSEIRSRYSAWLYSLANPRAAVLRENLDDAYLRLVDRGEAPPVRAFRAGFVIPGFPQAHR